MVNVWGEESFCSRDELELIQLIIFLIFFLKSYFMGGKAAGEKTTEDWWRHSIPFLDKRSHDVWTGQ